MLKKPELLAPAGSLKHLQMALDFGADAVYAGVPKWSLRVRGNGFVRDDFEKGIAYAHSLGKKVHAVLNIIPHVRRTQGFNAILDEMAALKPDAFIMGDPGLIDMVRERYPDIPIHLSVQANTVNAGSVKFWQKVGLTRCILARELSITEIDLIKQACPEMEVEVFIHGALCIAVSGRCLISGFLAHRDANIGACNNACRYGFKVRNIHSAHSEEFADPTSLSMQIEESMHHPNEWFNLEEDQCGSYLMNSKDLCALPILDKLIKTGVDSLKIEGRSRSPFYAAAISRAYRLAIDAIAKGEEVPPESYQIVNSIPSRGYTTGLLVPHRPDETQDYDTNAPSAGKWQIAGDITERDAEGRLLITVKNRFEKGSKMKLFTPQGLLDLSCEHMVDDRDRPVDVAPGSGYFVKVPYDKELDLKTTVLLRDDS
ncbi:MAG: U32 family peptidase C-terminal domain-containing protein [Succinatimonas sp.]|nr:U32 family peptidase C-terminal domain-containing protein [Succinatimonas sp.]